MRWVVTLGIVVSAAMALASCGGDSTTTVTTTAAIRMPRVAGQDATRAEAILRAVGLKTSYIAVPNNTRPGTVLAQHPATGSPVPKGSKATLTISALGRGTPNEVARGSHLGTPCGVIHFTESPHQARAIGATVASCREAKKLVRTAHGALGGCEKGAHCDAGGYTCTQKYFGGPRMSVQCESGNPANVPGPSAEVFWQWAGYNMTAGVAAKGLQHCGYMPTSGRPVPPGPTTVSGETTCAEALSLYRHGDRGSHWTCHSKQTGGRAGSVELSCTNGSRFASFGGLTP
jgi:hypothetical protein